MVPTVDLGPRDVRRNFLCLVWMGSVFSMGWSEVVTVLQPLLVHFGASNAQIGLVQGVLIASLPGMFLSPWITRHFPRKKIYLYIADTLYLLPVGAVGAVVWSGLIEDGPTMVGFIVLMMCAGQVAAGFGGLPNQEFFTACIPMRLRGRLAGMSAGLGGALGMAGAAIAAWLLIVLPKPQGFGALLVLAWFLCQVADTAILFAKEPPTPVQLSPRPWSPGMWRAFISDAHFLRVTILVCILTPVMGQLSIFSSVFGFRELHFAAEMAAAIGMAAAVSRLVLSPVAGWLTDKWGARNAFLVWPALTTSGFFLLALFPSTTTVLLAAGIASVAWSGFSGAMNALTCGIPRAEHRSGHFTLLGFCMVAANSLGPVVFGKMFDSIGYRPGFFVLGGLATVAILIGRKLLEPLSNRAEDYD